MGRTVKAGDAYWIEVLFSQTINILALKENMCTGSFGFYGSLDEWFVECKLSCNNNICQLRFLSQEILTSGATTNSAHRQTQLLPTPRGAKKSLREMQDLVFFHRGRKHNIKPREDFKSEYCLFPEHKYSLPSLLMTYHKVAQQLPSIMPHP